MSAIRIMYVGSGNKLRENNAKFVGRHKGTQSDRAKICRLVIHCERSFLYRLNSLIWEVKQLNCILFVYN